MDVKEYKKTLKNFEISEQARLRVRASAADDMLRSLPGEAEWNELFPDGPSLTQKRDSLIAVREEALAELKAKSLDLTAELERQKTATTGIPVFKDGPGIMDSNKTDRGDGFGANLSRIFADGSCPDKKVETIYIDPEDSYKQWNGVDDAPIMQATERNETNSAVIFDFSLTDSNNDPWNGEYVEGWLRIFWIYELPAWPYNAMYKLNIYGGLNVSTKIVSNNVFGHRRWAGYFAGGMAADNELVQVDNMYQPIFNEQKEWAAHDDSWNSGNVYLTKNWYLEAGESQSMYLYYWIYLFADRGTVNSVGTVLAKENNDIPSHPRLKCTISPAGS